MIRKTLALLRLENNYHHIHNPIHSRRNYSPFRYRRTHTPNHPPRIQQKQLLLTDHS